MDTDGKLTAWLTRHRSSAQGSASLPIVLASENLHTPRHLLQALASNPDLAATFRLDTVTGVASALAWTEAAGRVCAGSDGASVVAEEDGAIDPQLRRLFTIADRVVLTHADQVEPEAVKNLSTAIKALNPPAPILRGRDGDTATDRSLDLEAEVYELVALMRAAVPRGIALDVRSSLHGARVQASPILLQQVVMNLILNASEAGQELPSRVRIELRRLPASDAAGAWLELSVSDEGVGIPPELQSRIFDAHFTLKAHGHGLGLASVRDAVSQLGGSVAVDSVDGEGTTFRVRLREDRAARADAAPRPAPPRPTGRLALVVDDEPPVRALLSRMLDKLGYEVLVASDGFEAVEVADKRAAELDVVMLDLRMPGMDGWECLHELREIRTDLPVVVCSGHDPGSAEARPDDPLLGFLAKPFRVAALHEALARVTRNASPPTRDA